MSEPRGVLSPEQREIFAAIDNRINYTLNRYIVEVSAELNIPPVQMFTLMAGLPEVVSYALDDVARALAGRNGADAER